ncbi:MAG: AAA family ATPase, partial [Alistipes sp.]|nr:AAA family ATPase [Alistipes sp.]
MLNHYIAGQIYAKLSFEATISQKKVVEKLSEWLTSADSTSIFVLNGYAGTGKTTLVSALVEVFREIGTRSVLLAPTGRAAKVLSRYSGHQAYTIHKKIYREKTNAAYESKFSLDLNKERDAIFIVDEASMLSDSSGEGQIFGSGSLLDDLVGYVRSGRNCRLMLIGDNAQLPPVG